MWVVRGVNFFIHHKFQKHGRISEDGKCLREAFVRVTFPSHKNLWVYSRVGRKWFLSADLENMWTQKVKTVREEISILGQYLTVTNRCWSFQEGIAYMLFLTKTNFVSFAYFRIVLDPCLNDYSLFGMRTFLISCFNLIFWFLCIHAQHTFKTWLWTFSSLKKFQILA